MLPALSVKDTWNPIEGRLTALTAEFDYGALSLLDFNQLKKCLLQLPPLGLQTEPKRLQKG